MKKTIAIIGGGASALALAAMLNETLFDIAIYERQATVGRKFLVAGDGGFNLTHSEDLGAFIARYKAPARYFSDPARYFRDPSVSDAQSHFLAQSLKSFTNNDTRDWLKNIGIETYIGTSKRVFPAKSIKPIQVLNAILDVLKTKKIAIHTKYLWQGWDAQNDLIFQNNEVKKVVKADVVVFSLGGASWSKTGSDGQWLPFFQTQGIKTHAFQASNCAYQVAWDAAFLTQTEGKSLKNIALSCGDMSKQGEVVVTKFGLEGGAIYALSPAIREQLTEGLATVFVDLKPTLSLEDIKQKYAAKGNKSTTAFLKENLNLNETAIALLKNQLSKTEFTDSKILCAKIKKLPLSIIAAAPIDEAISTVGGIAFSEIDVHFQLKKLPNHYVIGEMLDWDAPTGGYLLQACFSMGSYLAQWLNSPPQY